MLLCLGMTWSLSHAQIPMHCGSDALEAEMAEQYPGYRAAAAAQLRDYVTYIESGTPRAAVTYTIPVVVHVIQSTPDNLISDARILSQIDIFNEDFRALNADTSDIPSYFQAADTDIEFCMATIDPNGCPTNGIVRIIDADLANHDPAQSSQLKGLSQWDPYRYLNVWLTEGIQGGILGYATGPNNLTFAPQNDGVVIDQAFYGRDNDIPASSYDLGRTGTHEVGHWLGLPHTFQGGCAGTNQVTCLTAGDFICDTPPTAAPNFGCPAPKNTCTETPVDEMDQTMNFMDYADDACLLMFSNGQSDRMHFVLDNIRSQIWSASNLTATGCDGTVSPGCFPTAAFNSDFEVICVGDSVQFFDQSTGPAQTHLWTFSNANGTSTSTAANPVVTFWAAGPVSVTLSVSNALGTDSTTITHYLMVEAPQNPPLAEGFESGTALPDDWSVADGDLGGTWEYNGSVGSTGTASAYVVNFGKSYNGFADDLISPALDFSNSIDGELVWDYAYRRRDAFRKDSLQIDLSTDCGRTWNTEWVRFGSTLASTAGFATSSNFVPGSGDWASDTLDLANYMGLNGVRIRFRSIGAGGQDIYLDNINISTVVGLWEAWEKPLSFSVQSPIEEELFVQLELTQNDRVSFQLLDLQGAVVWEQSAQKMLSGLNQLRFQAADIAQGLYLLQVRGDHFRAVEKVIKF